MTKYKILLITNETYGENEDLLLANLLKNDFDIDIFDISQTIPENYSDYHLFLFRNAWPGRIYQHKLAELFALAQQNKIVIYNALEQNATSLPSKEYLKQLYDKGYPVIPTYDGLEKFPDETPILIKPKNGGSSYGVEIYANKKQIIKKLENDYVIQKFMPFKREISLHYLDKQFYYALITKAPGMENRWEMEEFAPSAEILEFAEKFVAWNNLQYGIDRIDLGLTEENELLLIEIESDRCYLCLEELSPATLNKFIAALKKSLINTIETQIRDIKFP